MEGENALETAKILNINRKTVSFFENKFEIGGVESLLERRFISEKPTCLTNEQEQNLFGVPKLFNTY